MTNWNIRNIDDATVRAIRAVAVSRGLTIARYLAWLSERLPSEHAHATNCGSCGAYLRGTDEDDGCYDGCPLH